MIRFNVINKNSESVPMALDFCYNTNNNRRRTTVILQDMNSLDSYSSSCVLHTRDKDVKEVARKIALKKVMSVLGLDRNIRRQIWSAYFSRSPKFKHRSIAA